MKARSNLADPDLGWGCASAHTPTDFTHGYCQGWFGSGKDKRTCKCACHKASSSEAGVKP